MRSGSAPHRRDGSASEVIGLPGRGLSAFSFRCRYSPSRSWSWDVVAVVCPLVALPLHTERMSDLCCRSVLSGGAFAQRCWQLPASLSVSASFLWQDRRPWASSQLFFACFVCGRWSEEGLSAVQWGIGCPLSRSPNSGRPPCPLCHRPMLDPLFSETSIGRMGMDTPVHRPEEVISGSNPGLRYRKGPCWPRGLRR